jgi:HNH endonuclease
MIAWTELVAQVFERAQSRCEYCRMHQSLQGGTFHVEHILPSSRGGATELENLALTCPSCTLRKSDHTHALDPETRNMVLLYHPRRDRWDDHFAWEGYYVRARTSVGRATLEHLDFNHARRILIRQAEEKFGLFP